MFAVRPVLLLSLLLLVVAAGDAVDNDRVVVNENPPPVSEKHDPLVVVWADGRKGAEETVSVAVDPSVDDVVAVYEEDGTADGDAPVALRKRGASCFSHRNCTDCVAASSWCHWCGNDSTCRTRGSIHGCLYGSSCPKDDDDGGDDSNDGSGCRSHHNCSDCVLSSHLCNWCAKDNRCHAVASPYGCVRSVDCFSNDRCRRSEPEPLQDSVDFTEMKPLNLAILAVSASVLLFCLTFCYCCACGIKGSYDDLVYVSSSSSSEERSDRSVITADPPGRFRIPNNRGPPADDDGGGDDDDGEGEGNPEAAQNDDRDWDDDGGGGGDALVVANESYESDNALASPLLPRHPHDEEEEHPPSQPTTGTTTRRRIRSMQRLFNCCTFCYVLAVALVGTIAYGTVRYFPKKPAYNICNDALAWKSIMDSMSRMKVTADFEILMSVSNPNRFDVALDVGRGTFSHDNALVGTFDIPPVTASAMSVTDLMLVAHFAPEKWQALSISEEYYRGRLVLDVDSSVKLRVPELFDASFELETKDMVVHVNELSDRTLCACPSWSEAKNRTEFEALMMNAAAATTEML